MATLIDLTGQTFGRLTVLGRGFPVRPGGATWVCRCSCPDQTIKRISSASLRLGLTQSCGCFQKECTSARSSHHLEGKTFGRLTVIEREAIPPKRGVAWRCACSCGNMARNILSTNLVRGITKSCGCYQREQTSRSAVKDLTGKTFGWLTVVAQVGRTRRLNVRWLCRCAGGGPRCRGETTAVGAELLGGSRVSCGCAHGIGPNRSVRSDKVRAKSAAFSQARRAQVRGAEGAFTAAQVDALYERQKGKCAEPSCRKSLKRDYHRDHINPLALGGSNDIGNIQLLCRPCNRRKHAKDPFVWARENGRLL